MLYKKYSNGVQKVIVPPGAQPSGGLGELVANNEIDSNRDVWGSTIDSSMNAMSTTSNVALNPSVLAATGGLSALAIPAAGIYGGAKGYIQGKRAEQDQGQASRFNTNVDSVQSRMGQEVGYVDGSVGNTFGRTLHGDMNPGTIYAKHGIHMGGDSSVPVYSLTADFANAPKHEEGGLRYNIPVKSNAKNYKKPIEVEKGELELTSKDGRKTIVPSKDAKKVKEFLKSGNNLAIDTYIKTLPKDNPQGVYPNGTQEVLPGFDPSMPYGPNNIFTGQPINGLNFSGQPNYVEPQNPLGTPIDQFIDYSKDWFNADPTQENLQSLMSSYNSEFGNDPRKALNISDFQRFLDSNVGQGSTGGMGYGDGDIRNVQGMFTDAYKSYLTPKTTPTEEPIQTSLIRPSISGIDPLPVTAAPTNTETTAVNTPETKGFPSVSKGAEIAGLVGQSLPTIYNMFKGMGKSETYDPNYIDLPLHTFTDTFDPQRARTRGATNLASNTVYGANKAVQQQNAQMAKMRGAEMLNNIDNQSLRARAAVDAQNVDIRGNQEMLNLQALEDAQRRTDQAEANKTQYLEAGIKGTGRIAGDLLSRTEAKNRDAVSDLQQQQTLEMYKQFFPYMDMDPLMNR